MIKELVIKQIRDLTCIQ